MKEPEALAIPRAVDGAQLKTFADNPTLWHFKSPAAGIALTAGRQVTNEKGNAR